MSKEKQTVGMLMGVYNEANRIVGCLDFHLPYVDKVVIVIQQSEDDTEGVVDKYITDNKLQDKIKVLHFPKMGCSEATLQDGCDALDTDWVLYVDADEKFPEQFLSRMHEEILTNEVDGFRFERDNYFEIPVFGESVPIEPKVLTVKHPARDAQFRLSRKSLTVFPRQVHVRARVKRPDGSEHIKSLPNPIYHLKSFEEQWNDNRAYLPQTRVVDANEKTRKGELIKIPSANKNGMLYFAQLEKEVPFEIKRVFWITDVPKGAERGGHANKKVNEVLICLKGGVRVELEDGKINSSFILNKPDEGLFIRYLTWIKMMEFEEGTILLCLASELYDPKDYIGNHDEFLEAHKQK